MTPRILMIEEDEALRSSVQAILERSGYHVSTAHDGAAGSRALSSGTFEVVLLDLELPVIDGWRILPHLQPGRMPTVIVISGRAEERDKVRALDLGADDYVAKPFGTDELLARIRAVLRRANPEAIPDPTIRVDGIMIDLERRAVLKRGGEVNLTPKEYALLSQLARQAGTVMDQRTLLREVWGPSHVHNRNYLWTFIQRLRQKLEDDPGDPRVIISAGSRGYRLGDPTAP